MLLGVQLDDEVLLNGQVDVLLLGYADDLGGGIVPIEVQPLGGLPEGVGLQILLELLQAPSSVRFLSMAHHMPSRIS